MADEQQTDEDTKRAEQTALHRVRVAQAIRQIGGAHPAFGQPSAQSAPSESAPVTSSSSSAGTRQNKRERRAARKGK